VISLPTTTDVRLLGIRYLIVPSGVPPPVPVYRLVGSDRDYDLWEVAGWQPRVSVVGSWAVAPGAAEALQAVLVPGFDPARNAVLERDPGIGAPASSPASGSTTYVESTPEDVTIEASAATPSIVAIRTALDPGWSATVDGRPGPVLPTDFLLQGVPVGAGPHESPLTYRDGSVTVGLGAGAAAWLLLLAGIVTTGRRERRRRGPVHHAV